MDHKFKSKWESNSLMFDKGDYGYDGISWRQRNFMCNFCKKEYKSAQALGGHMNVHRRDRARLRLSSPSLLDHHPNPNPNPNPNIFSSPPASNSSNLLCLPNYKTTFHSSLFPLSSPSLTVNNQVENIFPFIPHDSSARNFLGDVMRKNMMNREGSHDVANFHGSFISNGVDDQEKESRVWKRRLEMDLLKDHGGLDLELRLGRP